MDMSTIKEMGNWNKKDILNALGVEQKESTVEALLPMMGIFAAGLLTGIGAGLMLAPKSGSELRGELADRASSARERATETVAEHIPAH